MPNSLAFHLHLAPRTTKIFLDKTEWILLIMGSSLNEAQFSLANFLCGAPLKICEMTN